MASKDRRPTPKRGAARAEAGLDGPAQALLTAAVREHQAGRLADAEQLYRAVLGAAPKHAQSHYLLGVVALQRGRPQAAIEWIGKALALNEGVSEWHYNLAFAYQSVRRLPDAVTHYRRAAALDPADAKVQTNLGNVLSELGALDEAALCYRQVLALQGDTSPTCFNLANILCRQGQLAQAIELYDRALGLAPNVASILTNSGIALAAAGRPQDAIARHQRAVVLDPSLAEARMNLGAALLAERRLDEALAQYEAVVALRGDHAEAHNSAGVLRMAMNDLGGAVHHFERAAALRPKSVPFHDNLARALLAAGDTVSALAVLSTALRIETTQDNEQNARQDTKRLVVWCLTGLTDFPHTEALRELVLQALTEPWGRIDDFAHVGAGLLKLNKAIAAAVARVAAALPGRLGARELLGDDLPAIAKDPLLRRLLESCPIANSEIERFLTALRAVILECAHDEVLPASDLSCAIELSAALAQQCFVNEYVYHVADGEAERLARLQSRLIAALAAGAAVPELLVLAVAAYQPLHRLPGAERLLDGGWPDTVARVLVQQIEEPRIEATAAEGISTLTAIEDDVSVAVRQQYEANPYPRWVKPSPALPPIGFRAFLRAQFPLAPVHDLPEKDDLDILIAGCGTGQHPIETARQFVGARVLAVDLSRASLAYAQRKTSELGLKQIDYAQADILNLGTLPRRFDLIESFGVLHHLADPFRGWRVLVSLLRRGGVMNIGLYSELARQDVVQARAFIAERGYGATVEEIRRFRHDVLALPDGDPLRALTARRDFFSTSNCRDLLFHVQEHRLTLPAIKAFLAETGLQLLGFVLDSRVQRLYAARFPDDPAMIDLDNWHAFETDNPRTFFGLYQLWVQKRA